MPSRCNKQDSKAAQVENQESKAESREFDDAALTDWDLDLTPDGDEITDDEIIASLENVPLCELDAPSVIRAPATRETSSSHPDKPCLQTEGGITKASFDRMMAHGKGDPCDDDSEFDIPEVRSAPWIDALLAELGNVDQAANGNAEHLPNATTAPVVEWSKNVSASGVERSQNVLKKRSKNVLPRQRRSAQRDAIIIGKVRGFDPTPCEPSLVSSPTPTPSTLLSAPTSPPIDAFKVVSSQTIKTRAGDNLIPVWSLTDDVVKVSSATTALQIAETRPVAFSFNLTPEAIERAKACSTGFLDSLKRALDRELKRTFDGVVFPYWFAVDIDDGENQRLHIHGAFLPPLNSDPVLEKSRSAMKDAWGRWEGPGSNKQVHFHRRPCDDGWATYAMRNQRAVAKIIGPRTFTITTPLRRDAKFAYEEIRRIMRAAC